jgi:protein phosphatase 1L
VHHFRPKFFILASDGLWDVFSNQEAVDFISKRLDEPHFGAKTITVEAFMRGSADNISVIVVVFRNGTYRIGSSRVSN